VHIHGGAFISQSSENAESYLRRWTNALKVPIFSIDYRLAPKNPFPDPVNDCYQAYYWLITQLKVHMGIEPETVIVTGDSAGGHLAVALTNLAIMRNFRVPDGLVLHYPAGNCNPNHFFPS
jgi:hormone-sensitive lipase